MQKNKSLLPLMLLLVSALAKAESTGETTSEWLPDHGRVLASGAAASDVKTIGGDSMLPVYGNQEGFVFADLMGDYGSDDTYLVSPGGGYRKVVDTQIVGGYFFGDYERTSLGTNFWVLSPGLEWMSVHWDAHANGYFPTSTSQQSGASGFASDFGDSSDVAFEDGTHNQYDQQVTPYAVIGNGVDAELGYSFSGLSGLRTRVYVGGYYYAPPSDDDVENIAGVTAGFEQPISENLHVALYNSYDQVSEYTVGVSLTLTLGQDSTVFSNNIHDRLLDPVERHVGIIDTAAGTYDQQHLEDSGMALQYDNVYFVSETASGTADGTYGNSALLTQDTLDAVNEESPGDSRIYVQGGDSATYYVNDTTTNSGDGFLLYDGQQVLGRSVDYKTPAALDQQPTIVVDSTESFAGFIMGPGEYTLSDLTITSVSDSNVVSIALLNNSTDSATLNMTNMNVDGTNYIGLLAFNEGDGDMTINMTNSSFSQSAGAGVLTVNTGVGDMTVNATDSYFNDNSYYGMIMLNTSTGSSTLNATGTQFNGNGMGFTAHNNVGTLTVNMNDSQLNDNVVDGMRILNLGTGSSSISVVNSTFNNNGETGLYVSNTSSGTLTVTDLTGSSFDSNGEYGIFGEGNDSGITTIDYTGATFSGGSQTNTNQADGDNINWIPSV